MMEEKKWKQMPDGLDRLATLEVAVKDLFTWVEKYSGDLPNQAWEKLRDILKKVA